MLSILLVLKEYISLFTSILKIKRRAVPVYAMKVYSEIEVHSHTFLSAGLGGGEWPISRPGRLISGKNSCTTECEAGVDPSCGLDGLERIKSSFPCRNSNPRFCSPWPNRHVIALFCFQRANWHSSATLNEVFPCFFLSFKANASVYLAFLRWGTVHTPPNL